jgi:hypothetical protein
VPDLGARIIGPCARDGAAIAYAKKTKDLTFSGTVKGAKRALLSRLQSSISADETQRRRRQ